MLIRTQQPCNFLRIVCEFHKYHRLTLSMLRIALTEYSQMSTHVPRFQDCQDSCLILYWPKKPAVADRHKVIRTVRTHGMNRVKTLPPLISQIITPCFIQPLDTKSIFYSLM